MPIIAKRNSEPEIDEVKRDELVREFRAALLDADVEEDVRAALVFEVHLKVRADWDLYEAVGKTLGSYLKNAIHSYVKDHQERQKRKAPAYEDLPPRWRPKPFESSGGAVRPTKRQAVRDRGERAKANQKP